ncbi:MAG: universal stress protein [Nocardioidaceae bacterium]
MTVAVAHQVSATSRKALLEAVREANYRGTDLAVLHVVESIDADNKEAYRLGVSDEIDKVVGEGPPISWHLHLVTAGGDLGDALLKLVEAVDADLLVIGARRRSPVGKALLGSVAQTVILEANLPVLVVKAP